MRSNLFRKEITQRPGPRSARFVRAIPVGALLLAALAGTWGAAQDGAADLYACGDAPQVESALAGLTLCDGLPTGVLSARAGPDNLQVRDGARVAALLPDGIAGVAGMRVGDLIYRVGGVDVPDARSAADSLTRVRRRSDTVVNFLRGGRPYRIKLRRR